MNRGAELLAAKIPERGQQKQLATSIGVDQGYLSKIVNGERVPGLKVRRILELRCQIAMQLWDEPPRANGSSAA